jgi:hypothetical protein
MSRAKSREQIIEQRRVVKRDIYSPESRDETFVKRNLPSRNCDTRPFITEV